MLGGSDCDHVRARAAGVAFISVSTEPTLLHLLHRVEYLASLPVDSRAVGDSVGGRRLVRFYVFPRCNNEDRPTPHALGW